MGYIVDIHLVCPVEYTGYTASESTKLENTLFMILC